MLTYLTGQHNQGIDTDLKYHLKVLLSLLAMTKGTAERYQYADMFIFITNMTKPLIIHVPLRKYLLGRSILYTLYHVYGFGIKQMN